MSFQIPAFYWKQVCIQLPAYADYVALPAFARRTPLLQQSTHICCHIAWPTAANPLLQVWLLWAHARTDRQTDRQTDRRTDTVPFYRPFLAYYAGSAKDRRGSISIVGSCALTNAEPRTVL